jgi:hypothetical protein
MNNKILTIIVGLALLAVIAPAVTLAALTEGQKQSIINVLISFGADQTAINNVQVSLNGGTPNLSYNNYSTSRPAACNGITFNRNISFGAKGADVKCLQAILNQSPATQVASSGAGSPGYETTTFGGLTKAAVIKYQAAQGWSPTGGVGPKTIALLNSNLSAVNGGGANCVSNYQQKCYGNSVYWYNSCGTQQSLVKTCAYGQTCSNGSCVTTNTSNCISNYQKECYNNYVYWYDSCGTQQSLYQTCSSSQTCSNGSCTGNNTNCTSNYQQECYGNSVYWYNSCGTQQSLYQTCSSSQTCSNGSCTGNNTNCTSNYQKRCYGNSVYWYNSCGTQQSLYQTCLSNQICSNGSCVADTPVLTTIIIIPQLANLSINQTQQLTATTFDQKGNNISATLTWTSYNNAVATVDHSSGLVKAVAVGSTTITAYNGSVNSTAQITVVPPAATSITITPSSATLIVAGNPSTQQLTAKDNNLYDITNTVNWASSNNAVATVSPTGLVTAIGTIAGTAIITASNSSGSVTSNSAQITVQPPLPTSITITPSSATLMPPNIGMHYSQQFTARDQNQNDITNKVTWASSGNYAVTINSSGLATAVASTDTDIRLVTITASNSNGSVTSNPSTITVMPGTPTASITSTNLNPSAGANYTLNWTFTNSNSCAVTGTTMQTGAVETLWACTGLSCYSGLTKTITAAPVPATVMYTINCSGVGNATNSILVTSK